MSRTISEADYVEALENLKGHGVIKGVGRDRDGISITWGTGEVTTGHTKEEICILSDNVDLSHARY